MSEKWVTVIDGFGFSKEITEDKIPIAEECYRELRELAKKAGDPPEEVEKYTLQIVRDED